MPVHLKENSSKETGRCEIAVGDDMTIYNAGSIHQELTGWFDEYEQFEIDLSAVESVDCSGIQMLLALKQSAEKHSKNISLCGTSDAVTEIMDVLNLRDNFTWVGESS